MKFRLPERSPKWPSDTTFLLWPRKCQDGYWRWLERVRVVTEYHRSGADYCYYGSLSGN